MTDPNDNLRDDITSDGELSEDSLFEWDGEEWVPVEHKPYTGFGLGRWYPDDPSVFEMDWTDGRPSPNTCNPRIKFIPKQIVLRGLAFLVIFIVFVAVILNVEDDQPWGASLSSSRVTQTPTRTHAPTATATGTIIPFSTICPGDFSAPSAYIFASANRIFAQMTRDSHQLCSLLAFGEMDRDPRLSADGQRLFYRIRSQIRYYDLELYRDFAVVSSTVGDIQYYDLSPDSRRLTYVVNGMLHLRDLNTNATFNYRQLANQTPVTYPVWSPDGSEILFTASSQIARVAIDGSDYSVIYDNPTDYPHQSMVAWSPDGSQIASLYAASPGSEHRGLLVMNRDGTNVREIIPAGDALISNPQWLADGQQIAVLQRDSADADVMIAIYDLEGTLVSRVEPRYPIDIRTSGFQIWYGSE